MGRRLVPGAQGYHRPPHRNAWLCIHRYEGAWTDGGAPYYGGLQMDWGFMRTYGGCFLQPGTADKWTPVEQMWVAERALPGRPGLLPVAEHGPRVRIDLEAILAG